MRTFHCDQCQNIVYIENAVCYGCNAVLAFLPDEGLMSAMVKQEDGSHLATATGEAQQRYRLCDNDVQYDNCNWAIPVDDPHALCISCRLTEVIPDLSVPGHLSAWGRVEQVKRRLLYNCMRLDLRFESKEEDPYGGLSFNFLADPPPGSLKIFTGHLNGQVTINIAEADDDERERRRLNLREPYRTLLGHLRHEMGHYYWDRMIRDRGQHESFRELFGDERVDYGGALADYYTWGPRGDWQSHHVTSYASAHPFEDWAETFAHYFHIFHTLDTASHCGVAMKPPRDDEPKLDLARAVPSQEWDDFDRLIDQWIPLTYLLNSLTRSLGQPDAYPFVLKREAVAKLRYVHGCILEYRREAPRETRVSKVLEQ